MSRVGKQIIVVPKDVEVKLQDQYLLIKGPKGELNQKLLSFLSIDISDNELKLSVKNPREKKQRSIWGTFNRLISNMIIGVTQGFEKKLEIIGVGYKAQINNNKLILNVGFSHPVEYLIPKDVEVNIEKNVITVKGIDKQLVGEVSAQIRKIKKPEPYKGKGIKYVDEVIRRKAGKKKQSAE